MEVQKKIKEILAELNEDLVVGVDDPLLSSGLIDSLMILAIISRIEEEFQLEFNDDELEAENFESISRIEKMIALKMQQ
ncbi:MAG: acyl carrier protein [Solirubrobacterales bacterium]